MGDCSFKRCWKYEVPLVLRSTAKDTQAYSLHNRSKNVRRQSAKGTEQPSSSYWLQAPSLALQSIHETQKPQISCWKTSWLFFSTYYDSMGTNSCLTFVFNYILMEIVGGVNTSFPLVGVTCSVRHHSLHLVLWKIHFYLWEKNVRLNLWQRNLKIKC